MKTEIELNGKYEIINSLLVEIFNKILKFETISIRKLTKNKLTVAEVHTLEAIGFDKVRTMTVVAKKLGITVSTLTTCINRLVQRGLVERTRIEEDRRIVCLKLTETGKHIVFIHKHFHTNLIKAAIKGINDSQIDVLIKCLDNIVKNFGNVDVVKQII